MKTAPLRYLLPLLLVLALAACGNKGPLVMPPSPVPADQPRQVDEPLDEDEFIEDDAPDDASGARRGT
ncbi:LPS translocon maturation chaperone LptM [Alkalisalibacterium limincola]|uniref:Sugar transporter n=1 Tax=Alkalisalibacterium limincola TaxID=2699169 RepID=A0A5C8KYB3_9GAMM|nr:lipoprotein [Alkalisalibacterium limincola]TXK64843.1 sugar transporter [Alkalisalibacterium limincola]